MTDRKVAWLIERRLPASGLDGPQHRWYAENSLGFHWWTPDAKTAMKFSTRIGAEAFTSYQMIYSDPDISITEHVFMKYCPHDCYRPGDCDGSCTHPVSTQLPWHIERDTSSVSEPRIKLVGANGDTVADNEPYYPEAIKEADAELIAIRVNAHAAPVSALEPFANMPMPESHGVERERIHKARIALALAKSNAA